MKKAIMKYLLIGSVCVLFAVLGMVTYKKSQENKIVFTISDKICVPYGDNIDISNMQVIKNQHLHEKKNKTHITVEGDVNTRKIGDYDIDVIVRKGNKKASKKIVVEVADKEAPVIELSGDIEMTIEAGTQFEEPGFSADDNYDGDLTEKVEKNNDIDTCTKQDVTITYSVKDSSGNEAVANRTVHIVDTTPPQITLTQGSTCYVKCGTEYMEAGYYAEDICDGDITDKVQVTGDVNTRECGSYTVSYKVSDSSGNTAEAVRTVRVYKPMTDNVVNPGDKVVYLTFDDGPGPYTQELLDVLDRYNVKATFFVTNGKPDYQNLIAEEASRGHTVAIHSASHDYSRIYQSVDAYFDDLNEMNNIILAQTGKYADIVRFPGGSSNTVSRSYCEGIMSQLVCAVEAKGFRYCDWNVSSGDAGSANTASQVICNVINGIKGRNISIVLQHDIKKFSVDAVEEIIQWGLSEGYTFLPITSTTPMSHHGINN
jgi:peptidoglycan/xylan/chitin deacetylase (PgdA/CDA1 family)